MTGSRDIFSRAGALADHMPGLLLAAEQVAHSFMKGVHGRRRVGMGDAFWQFRPYQPGDETRGIDWRQTGKRDQIFIRQTEWEAAQTVWLYRDMSASMDFKSATVPHTKKDYAEILLLALGMVCLSGGEQVSLLGTDLLPQASYPFIGRIYDALPLQTHLIDNSRPVPGHSHVVLISDFYYPLESLVSFCENLAARRVKGTLVQVFDPIEQSFPYTGHVKFQDMEEIFPDALDIAEAGAVRDEYHRKFTAHQKKLSDLAAILGWTFEAFSTDVKPEVVLVRLYNDLSVKNKKQNG